MFLRKGALLQVLLDEVVVGFGDRLHELLASGVGQSVQVLRPLRLLGSGPVGVEVRLLVQEVGDTVEFVLASDRQLEGSHLVPERGDELVEGRLEVRPLAVELVDEDRPRQPRLDGELPRHLRLDLDAVDGRDHDDDRVDRPDRRSEVADEVGVSGSVQHVDLRSVPLDRRHRQRDGDPLALFVGVVVGDRGAVFDGSHPGDGPRREQHGFEQRGLAGPSVTDQQDVADVLRVVGLQRALLGLGEG